MRIVPLILLLACTVLAQNPDPIVSIATDIKDGYNRGDQTLFLKHFNDTLIKQWKGIAFEGLYKNAQMGWGVIDSLGKPEKHDDQTVTIPVKMSNADTVMTLKLDQEGKVSLFELKEFEGIDFANPKLASVFYRFPLEGIWKVMEGGDTAEQNRHHASVEDAFAMDFVKWTEGAASPSLGQVIHSPGACQVSQTVGTIPDNAPGASNPMFPNGNFMALSCGGAGYVIFPHLKSESLKVKAGDKVLPGQPLALSGDSGVTQGSGITVTVRTSLVGQSKSKSMKFGFACVEKLEGKTWSKRVNYYPVKGDVLRLCPEEPAASKP